MFLSINKIIRCASSVMIARFTSPCQADQSLLQPLLCRSTIHLGQSKKKRMRDRVSCAKVELPHNNLAKGDHISHEQEYNTGHGIPAISHEVRRKIRRQPRQSEIQQEPVVHLLLEAALGWKCGIPGLSVQAASQPSKPAYGSRTETHPGHAPQKSIPGHD